MPVAPLFFQTSTWRLWSLVDSLCSHSSPSFLLIVFSILSHLHSPFLKIILFFGSDAEISHTASHLPKSQFKWLYLMRDKELDTEGVEGEVKRIRVEEMNPGLSVERRKLNHMNQEGMRLDQVRKYHRQHLDYDERIVTLMVEGEKERQHVKMCYLRFIKGRWPPIFENPSFAISLQYTSPSSSTADHLTW